MLTWLLYHQAIGTENDRGDLQRSSGQEGPSQVQVSFSHEPGSQRLLGSSVDVRGPMCSRQRISSSAFKCCCLPSVTTTCNFTLLYDSIIFSVKRCNFSHVDGQTSKYETFQRRFPIQFSVSGVYVQCCCNALTRTLQLWGQHWRPEEAHCCPDRNTTSQDCVKEMVSRSFQVQDGLNAFIDVTKTDLWLSDRYTIFKDHVTLGDCILSNTFLQLVLVSVVQFVEHSKS